MSYMFRNSKRWILLAMCLLLLLPTGCTKEQEDTVELMSQELIVPEEANYKTATVEIGDYINQRTTSGSVGFLITTDLYWDKEGCRYQEVLVEKGAAVSEGDVLIRFTTDESEVNLEEKQLNLKRVQEEYAVTKSDKQKELAVAREGLNGLSSYEYQIAQQRCNALQTSYEQYCYEKEFQIQELKHSIEEMEEEMNRDSIKAPYDGIIEWMATCTVGDKVPVGTTLISMYSTDKIAVRAENPSGAFAYNQSVTLTAGSKDNQMQYEGRIVSADNILPLDMQNQYMVIQVTSEIPQELLDMGNQLLGMSVTVAGITETIKDVLIVTRQAVELENGQYYVQLLEDGVIKKRFVTMGCANNNGNGSVVWLVDGVEEGDVVVLFK